MVAFLLLVVGGLNWLLYALAPSWEVSAWLGADIAKVVFILVGLAALFEVFTHKGRCKECNMMA